jgi:hypothetical protein
MGRSRAKRKENVAKRHRGMCAERDSHDAEAAIRTLIWKPMKLSEAAKAFYDQPVALSPRKP